ncbi:MAG: class I SAM-dependent methyltransferase [Proteobacteria bacterium]|nr:class I SAM-dependent methyltransferase [Pseudomonadota bacterium]
MAATSKTPAYIAAAIADKNRPEKDTARDADRKPAEMLKFAGIRPGMVVVDLIPGRGYFTRIFAGAVGPKGHVYAFIPTEFDAVFKKNNVPIPTGTDPNYPNVTYIHASIANFPIPQYADVVWTSQNYHDLHDSFTGPVDLAVANKAVFAALKPGGAFVVLDHVAQKGSGLRDTDTLHRIDPASVKSEVTAAGFKFAGESNVLRNPRDPHDKLVFDPSIRGKTDQFIYKFRKPKK